MRLLLRLLLTAPLIARILVVAALPRNLLGAGLLLLASLSWSGLFLLSLAALLLVAGHILLILRNRLSVLGPLLRRWLLSRLLPRLLLSRRLLSWGLLLLIWPLPIPFLILLSVGNRAGKKNYGKN